MSGRKRSGRKRKCKRRRRKKVKYRRNSWWKKLKERIASFLAAKRKELEKEKKGRKSDKCPGTRQVWGKSGRLLQQRTEMMERRQPKGEDRTKMKKVAKLLRCTKWISVEYREEVHEKV